MKQLKELAELVYYISNRLNVIAHDGISENGYVALRNLHVKLVNVSRDMQILESYVSADAEIPQAFLDGLNNH